MRKGVFRLLPLWAILLAACTVFEDVEPHPVGWQSPSLWAPDQYGREISLDEMISGPWALVFFYPEADTPG